MKQPNPWILFAGGFALVGIGLRITAMHLPVWARYAGGAACVLLGVASVVAALVRQFQKRPPRPKFVPRRKRSIDP